MTRPDPKRTGYRRLTVPRLPARRTAQFDDKTSNLHNLAILVLNRPGIPSDSSVRRDLGIR